MRQGLKIVLRRELFGTVTFTELSVTLGRRKLSTQYERPQKDTDLSYHWKIGK